MALVTQRGRNRCGVALGEVGYFSLRSAVKPMPRRLGCGEFISSRMAERMAAMASSWCWYLRSSSSSLRASAVLEARGPRRRTKARRDAQFRWH